MDVEEQQPNASMKEERATEEQVVATNSTTSTDHMVETSQRPASDTGDPATTGGSTEEKDGKHSITLLAANGTDPSASSNTSNSVGVTVLPIAAGIGMSPLRAHLAGNKMGGSFANVLFYRNVLPSSPSGDFIDNIHSHWKGKYSFLEAHHGYIQWLFPLFEGTGLNSSAQKLNKEEAKMMREDLAMAKRLVKSYQLMLHFYGMRLADKRTGRIIRRKNYAPRYRNLNTHSHNFLRITRILTSLGHLGFIRYKEAWLRFLSEEIGKEGLLPECSYALHNFWLPLLDVENPSFIEKTGETAEDRTESVYFAAIEQSDWQDSDKEEESEEELGVEEGDAMQESSSSAARMSIAMQSGSSSQEMTSSSTQPPVATRESATNTPTQGRGGRKRASMGERKSRMRGGKICAYCGATETPEWRSGPEGKQTLCNSCGLYYSRHGTLNGRDGQPRHSVSRTSSSSLGSSASPSSSAASFASSLRGLAGSATFIAGGPEGSQQITSLTATSPLPARSANGRVCVECKTTETPEWRSGPEGKHTLCNRCGLHYARSKRLKEMGGTPRAPRKRTRVTNNNNNNTKETNQLIGTAGMPLAPLNVMSLPGVVALPSASSSTSSSISTIMPATATSNLASIPAPKHETEGAAPTEDAPQPQSVGDRREHGEDTNSAGPSSFIQQPNATKVEELRGEESAVPPASTGIGVAEPSSGGGGASNGSSSAGGVLLSAPTPATNINPYVVDYKQRLQSRSCGFCGTRDTPNWRSGRTAAEILCNRCGLQYARTGTLSPPNTKRKRSTSKERPTSSPAAGDATSTSTSNAAASAVTTESGASPTMAVAGGTPPRTCSYCGVTSTPEWRKGPDGKQSLCNSCGLRYRRYGTLQAMRSSKGKSPRKKSREEEERSSEPAATTATTTTTLPSAPSNINPLSHPPSQHAEGNFVLTTNNNNYNNAPSSASTITTPHPSSVSSAYAHIAHYLSTHPPHQQSPLLPSSFHHPPPSLGHVTSPTPPSQLQQQTHPQPSQLQLPSSTVQPHQKPQQFSSSLPSSSEQQSQQEASSKPPPQPQSQQQQHQHESSLNSSVGHHDQQQQ